MTARPVKHAYQVKDERRAPNGELPLLSVSIYRGVVPRSELTDKEARADDLSAYKAVAAGDVVINRMSAYQGALGIADRAGVVSPEYIVLRPRAGVDGRYLTYLFKSAWFVFEMTRRVRGIGGVGGGANVRTPRINPEDLGLIVVDLPSGARQSAIADHLDREVARIDAVVARRLVQAALLDSRLSAARKLVLLRGLDPTTGSGLAQQDWSVAKLGVLVTLHRGHDLPEGSRRNGAVPVISSGGVSGWHDTAVCMPPGVVTGRYGTIGEVYFVDVPFWPLNTTLYISDFRGNDPHWVKELLAALPLERDAEKSAVGGIDRKVIGDLRVPVVPLPQQRAIAREVDVSETSVKRAIDAVDRQIALLQERRQALITAAVTGEPDLARG